MEYDPMSPIWLQVVNRIKGSIATGQLAPGEKMPGGRDLAVRYSINPNTAARVYQELEKAGICETRRGMGTYVTGDGQKITAAREEMIRQTVEQFLENMARFGVSPEDAAKIILKEENSNA